MKAIRYTLVLLACSLTCSCVTSYDRYGNPIQTVDPVAATVGAVAIGAVAYSAGQNNSYNNNYYRSYNRGYSSSCRSYSSYRPNYNLNQYTLRSNHGYNHYNHYKKRCK